MNNTSTTGILCLLLSLFLAPALNGQAVIWPGDMNNNGRVTEVDLLFWGHAFGAEGESRPNGDMSWSPQPMGTPWPGSFPSGTNFAYADANADKAVTRRDLKALSINRGNLGPAPASDGYRLPDTSGNHLATLVLQPAGTRLTADGNFLILNILLEGRNGTFDRFYSMALAASLRSGDFANYERLSNSEVTTADSEEVENGTAAWARVDSTRAQFRYALTNTRHQNRTVTNDRLAQLLLPLAADFNAADLATLTLDVDSLLVFDAAMQPIPVALRSGVTVSDTDCSLTVDPVTGTNGTTYLNACFAEAAGITFYTAGAAWNPGLDVNAMNPSANCSSAYEPVCGFNGVTYENACVAEAAGVVDYFTGLCAGGAPTCYDANLIVISSGTSVDNNTGIISLLCTAGSGPVCGCDGNNYASACLAEASGIRNYTVGGCGDGCVDPGLISDENDCPTTAEFVCGCNGTTYVNPCFADAAGIQDWTPGPCGGSSNWCAEATVISCGEYLPNESTVGAGNQLTSYPGCTSSSMLGPDRVYTFQKTTAGDLQIGLEIMTAGLNMDIFLLTGDCNNYTCIAASTTSNSQTNNEGIVVEDAPNGTYYIVVDQRSPGVGGNYRLELSCGYLDCSQSVPLSCGVPYVGSNAGGTDDVSTYTFGNQLNVENNGPEIVHTFTTTEAGRVQIDLSGLSANLELFLLSECDRGSGLAYSQNPGTNSEQIIRTLPAGTYYVVVDGYNGAVSSYNLTVDCNSTCGLEILEFDNTPGSCGQADGSYSFRVTGGVPHYAVHYVGPVCRSAVSNNGFFTFNNLPPGVYTATVNDCAGCSTVFTFTIGSGDGGLAGFITEQDAGCGSDGGANIVVSGGGQPPYSVFVDGGNQPVLVTSQTSFSIPLSLGPHGVRVADATGCSFSDQVTIDQGGDGLIAHLTTEPTGCDGELGYIRVQAQNGNLPFHVRLIGPVSGSQGNINGYTFRLRSLRAGAYTVILTDAFGCSTTQQVVVGEGGLDAQVSATPANCDSPGAVRVNITGGTPPYTINYSGPQSGTINTNDAITVINGLTAGSYTFSIWSDEGCDVSETVFVEDNGGTLNLTTTQTLTACGDDTGTLQINVGGGNPNYSITYSGPVSGSLSIGGSGVGELDLPAGVYTITATDFGGCSATEEVIVLSGLEEGDHFSFAYGNDCGQLDNIRTALSGGNAPYDVVVTNDCNDEENIFTTLESTFELENLANCTYSIQVTDANGCSSTEQVTIAVDGDDGVLVLTARNGACDGVGRIDLEITAGESPYFINWTGPVSGNVNLASQQFSVTDLPAGTYTFNLTNASGCDVTETITLQNNGSLEIVSSIVTDDCGAPDQIWNDIEGGTGPYEVTVTRSCDGADIPVDVIGDGFEILDVLCCDYTIMVTDANGCTATTVVEVPCFQLFTLFPTDVICGQPGSIRVEVMNGNITGPFTVTYTGPIGGGTTDMDGNLTIQNLVAGTYTVTLTNPEGCTETESVTLNEVESDLMLTTAIINNECGQYNQLWNDIEGGVPPYTIEVIRLCDNIIDTTFTQNGTGFELTDLEECDYKVKVTDAIGCMVMTTTTVEGGDPDLVNVNPVSGPCGSDGRIDINFVRGTAPYQVVYTGPISGDITVNGTITSINDAPAGDYTIMVTDANGCTETETTTVEATTNDLELQAALIYNECGQYNQIWIDIFNGTGPFSITVTRLCDSTVIQAFVSGEVGFELFDLEPCDYKIVVTDQAGCMAMDIVTVFPSNIELFTVTPTDGECNDPGTFGIEITRGTAPFTVTISGPIDTSFTGTDTTYFYDDVPSGNYTIFVTDSVGCTETEQFTITNTFTDLDLVTSLIFNECGQLNQLWNDINGGTGPFDVVVTRLCDNTVDTTFTTTEREFELLNRVPCTYKIKVTDATGCMDMETIRVIPTNADLFDVTKNTDCADGGFDISFTAGQPPYLLEVAGPTSGVIPGVTEDIFFPAISGDYMIRATSSDGCMETLFTSLQVTGSGTPPTADFEVDGGDDFTFTFTSTGSAGTYAWDFGDGSTSTAANPTYTYPENGDYNVCLTVTNDCGADTYCETIEVADEGELQIVIGGASGARGRSVRVPVSVQGLTNLATLSGTFSLSDPGLATLTHVTAGSILPQFNPDNNTFSYVSQNTGGENLPAQINVLFFLHFDLGDQTGSVDIDIIDSPVDFQVSGFDGDSPRILDVSYLPGFLIITDNLLGNISTQSLDANGAAVTNVDYQLRDPDGTYLTSLPEDPDGIASTLAGLNLHQMYYVEPHKTGDWAHGLSTFEIFLGRRLLLGYSVPELDSPLRVIATDMNCSNSFSNLDLTLMQMLLVGNVTSLPDCESWAFVHESMVFPADWNERNVFPFTQRAEIMLIADTMTMFEAIKRGDLLGDANPGRSNELLPLEIELPESYRAGEIIDLPVRLTAATDLVSLQTQLKLSSSFQLLSLEDGEMEGIVTAEDRFVRNELRLSWYSNDGQPRAMHAGANILTVRVRALENGGIAGDLLSVSDRDYGSEAYDGDLRRLRPDLTVVRAGNGLSAIVLNAPQPNPAREDATVSFELPEATTVEVQLFDGLGRRVLRRTQGYGPGVHRQRIDLRQLPAGVYRYQIRAGAEMVTGQLVVSR